MKAGLILFSIAFLVSSVVCFDDDKSMTLHKKMVARRREVSCDSTESQISSQYFC